VSKISRSRARVLFIVMYSDRTMLFKLKGDVDRSSERVDAHAVSRDGINRTKDADCPAA
jgi:hypothetical protein